MKRLLLNVSTTALVMLLTMGALDRLEKQNYIIAGVYLFIAFLFPAQNELDTLFRRRFGIATGTKVDSKTGRGVESQEKSG